MFRDKTSTSATFRRTDVRNQQDPAFVLHNHGCMLRSGKSACDEEDEGDEQEEDVEETAAAVQAVPPDSQVVFFWMELHPKVCSVQSTF